LKQLQFLILQLHYNILKIIITCNCVLADSSREWW